MLQKINFEKLKINETGQVRPFKESPKRFELDLDVVTRYGKVRKNDQNSEVANKTGLSIW